MILNYRAISRYYKGLAELLDVTEWPVGSRASIMYEEDVRVYKIQHGRKHLGLRIVRAFGYVIAHSNVEHIRVLKFPDRGDIYFIDEVFYMKVFQDDTRL